MACKESITWLIIGVMSSMSIVVCLFLCIYACLCVGFSFNIGFVKTLVRIIELVSVLVV